MGGAAEKHVRHRELARRGSPADFPSSPPLISAGQAGRSWNCSQSERQGDCTLRFVEPPSLLAVRCGKISASKLGDYTQGPVRLPLGKRHQPPSYMVGWNARRYSNFMNLRTSLAAACLLLSTTSMVFGAVPRHRGPGRNPQPVRQRDPHRNPRRRRQQFLRRGRQRPPRRRLRRRFSRCPSLRNCPIRFYFRTARG